MKFVLTIDTEVEGDLGNAYKVLNLFKKGADAAPAAPQAPNAAPAAPTPPVAPSPAAPPPAPASVPAAPAPSPAPAPAPAPAPPPPAAVGGITSTQMNAQIQEFAKKYSPKACKARFGEMSAALGVSWSKTTDIPQDRYSDAMAWFATA